MSDGQAPAVTAITDGDVRTLAAKLKGLHALLTPGEQALLHLVLRRAAGRVEGADAPGAPADTPDAAGHAWAVSFNPFAYLDAIAADPSSQGPPAR